MNSDSDDIMNLNHVIAAANLPVNSDSVCCSVASDGLGLATKKQPNLGFGLNGVGSTDFSPPQRSMSAQLRQLSAPKLQRAQYAFRGRETRAQSVHDQGVTARDVALCNSNAQGPVQWHRVVAMPSGGYGSHRDVSSLVAVATPMHLAPSTNGSDSGKAVAPLVSLATMMQLLLSSSGSDLHREASSPKSMAMLMQLLQTSGGSGDRRNALSPSSAPIPMHLVQLCSPMQANVETFAHTGRANDGIAHDQGVPSVAVCAGNITSSSIVSS